MKVRETLFCFFLVVASAFGQISSPFVGGAWCGNVTPTSATATIRLTASGQKIRWVVSQNEVLTPAIYSSAVTTAPGTGNTTKVSVQGLQPDTDYRKNW